MPTARITAELLSNAQFQGQSVRAVGKLVGVDAGYVQLQLAGSESLPPAMIMCPNGVDKYPVEQVGKGCFEVIGTLQSGNQITEMTSVYMGENFGTPLHRPFVRVPSASLTSCTSCCAQI